MPGTKDVQANIRELVAANKDKRKKGKRSMAQIVAIAYSQAREKGAKV